MEAFDTFEDWWDQYTIPEGHYEGKVREMLEDAYQAGIKVGVSRNKAWTRYMDF
jgi:hypothetical protein